MDLIKIGRKNLQNLIFSNLCRQFLQLVSAFSELDISLICPTCNQAPQVQMHLPVNDWVPSVIYNFNLQGGVYNIEWRYCGQIRVFDREVLLRSFLR